MERPLSSYTPHRRYCHIHDATARLRLPWRPLQHRGDIVFGCGRILVPCGPSTVVQGDIMTGEAAVAPAPAAPIWAAANSRSLNFCTFPLDVMGKASRITVYRGILKLASCPRQKATRPRNTARRQRKGSIPTHPLLLLLVTGGRGRGHDPDVPRWSLDVTCPLVALAVGGHVAWTASTRSI
jgi:hypothetical protein